ncbi:MAG: hypothetical protein C0504_12950 [Candidatus Solibacter sp.]|nr:hypothetical protein [Candidatus Solibacter sp.]
MTKLSIVSLCWTALAFAALAPAQDTKETPKASPTSKPGCCVQQVYQVKHANVRDLYHLLFTRAGQDQTPYLGYNESLRAISVYGTPQEVNSIMANLKMLDVPSNELGRSKSVELTLHLITASRQATSGDALPPSLYAVARQLTDVFGYRGLRLLDTAVIRGRTGEESNMSGNGGALLEKESLNFQSPYQVSVRIAQTRPATQGGNIVQVDNLRFNLRVPYCTDPECKNVNYQEVGVRTNFDVREGQNVVVGKSKMDNSDRGLVLVVSAKVVD